jgi:uncharacterized protein YpmS
MEMDERPGAIFLYLFGLLFLGIGFWHWIPMIVALRAEETALRKSQEELKQRIAELTAERNKLKTIIECELGYAAREAAAQLEPGKKS